MKAVVFVMTGCGACHQYVPRFSRIARTMNAPFRVIDVSKTDPRIQAMANRYGVKATPTTIVHGRDGKMHKTEGAVDDAAIQKALSK